MRNLSARGAQVALLQLHPLGQFAEELGRLLRHVCVGVLRTQDVVVAEERAQNIQRRKRAGCGHLVAIQIVQVEGVDALPLVRKLGMHLEALEVANH